jgi:hypothetical protein
MRAAPLILVIGADMTTDHPPYKTRNAWAGQCRPSVVFALDVAAEPVLTFEAANLREAAQLAHEEWLREDLTRLRSNNVPLWDGMALIRARYATPDEIEHHRNAIRDAEAIPGDLLLAYIVDLDGARQSDNLDDSA